MATLGSTSPFASPILTPRLRITPVNSCKQALEIYRLVMDTDIHFGLELPVDLTFRHFKNRLAAPPVFALFKVEQKWPAALIGMLAVWEHSPVPGWPQILFGIHPRHRGCGHAGEAAQGLLHHLIERMKVPGVCGIAESKNITSVHILESLGMHSQGPVSERRIFCISREDYRAASLSHPAASNL